MGLGRKPDIFFQLPFQLLTTEPVANRIRRLEDDIFQIIQGVEPLLNHGRDVLLFAVALRRGSMLQSRPSSAFLRLAISEKIWPSFSTISSKRSACAER
jgi:hypothetical protein